MPCNNGKMQILLYHLLQKYSFLSLHGQFLYLICENVKKKMYTNFVQMYATLGDLADPIKYIFNSDIKWTMYSRF